MTGLDLDNRPVLTEAEQLELARKYQAGDHTAKAALIESHLRLVCHWAHRYAGKGVEVDDLIQEGVFGLDRAIDKFRWGGTLKFSTYATFWVRRYMQLALQGAPTVRVPETAARRHGAKAPEVRSLDAGTGEAQRVQEMPDPDAGEQGFLDAISQKAVREAVLALPPHLRSLVVLRFGLADGQPRTLSNCARRLGMSYGRARNLEAEALSILRDNPLVQVG